MRLVPCSERDGEDDEKSTEEGGSHALGAGSVLEVQLWKPEALHATVEVDDRLVITSADLGAQLMWGHEAKTMVKQRLHRYVAVLEG